MTPLIILFAFLALLFMSLYRTEKKRREKIQNEIKDSYGKPGSKKISSERLSRIREIVSADIRGNDGYLDDITWNDLDMDRVYLLLNTCRSSSGDEMLYEILRNTGVSKDDLDSLESSVCLFSNDRDLCLKARLILNELGTSVKYPLRDYLDYLTGDHKDIKRKYGGIIADFLLIPALVLIFIKPVIGAAVVTVLLLYQVFSYLNESAKIEKYLSGLSYIMRLADSSHKLRLLLPDGSAPGFDGIEEDTDRVSSIIKKGRYVISSHNNKGSSGPFEMLMTYLNMFFHFDIIAFYGIIGKMRGEKERIIRLIRYAGSVDSYIAIASFREYLRGGLGYCVPEFADGEMIVSEGYHPLIKDPIVNSIKTDRGILLTGSNASGKSTFLRMVALNAVLAQTVHTSLSKEYRAPFYRIYSSIALTDSIVGGESYFMAEIKSLKRILDAASGGGRKVLCFVDEVLRGTNTKERIAAGYAVLKDLAAKGVLCFAATHDVELTGLLQDEYTNMHFGEELTGDDIMFSYRIAEGKATSTNAILLLERFGFGESIIRDAKNMIGGKNE